MYRLYKLPCDSIAIIFLVSCMHSIGSELAMKRLQEEKDEDNKESTEYEGCTLGEGGKEVGASGLEKDKGLECNVAEVIEGINKGEGESRGRISSQK